MASTDERGAESEGVMRDTTQNPDRLTRRRAGTWRKHNAIRRTDDLRTIMDAARLAQAMYERRIPVQLLLEEVVR